MYKPLLLLLFSIAFSQIPAHAAGVRPATPMKTVPPTRFDDPALPDHYKSMVNYHLRMDGNVPEGAAVFIGDSITQSLCVSAVTTPAVNYGIGGDSTEGVLLRIPEYASLEHAGVIVIAIGINDMNSRPDEEILRNIKRIVSLLPNQVPVLLNAVLPLDETYRDDWKGRNRERIFPLNDELAAFTATLPHVHFLNAGPDMLDADGNLKDTCHIGDGLHLSTAGYTVWIRHLKQALDSLHHE